MQRNQSLDALRGFAIFAMVLSGSVAYGDCLPGWMYHAQVPPPLHQYNPNLPGITWVDLVFPFFLFSMGAAIPFALQKKEYTTIAVFWIAIKRFVLLAFFALFFEHTKAWVIASSPNWQEYLVSIASFILIIFQLNKSKTDALSKILKIISFLAAILLLVVLPFQSGKGFNFYKSDIIIMVLANMAFFGTIIWWFTRNNIWLRIGLLPFIMGVFFAAKEPSDSWIKTFYEWNAIGSVKINWLYQFYFLKYLFIIIPGTIVGEYLLSKKEKQEHQNEANKKMPDVFFQSWHMPVILSLIFLLVFVNLYALWNRYLFANLIGTLILLINLNIIYKNRYSDTVQSNLLKIATYLLLLGLFWEAFQGGIKKDSSTYSYYFVTTGLAIFAILFFENTKSFKILHWATGQFASIGKNPLLAYMFGSLLLLPVLHLTKLFSYWDQMNSNAFLGFLKGLLFTITVCWITNTFTKQKIILKT